MENSNLILETQIKTIIAAHNADLIELKVICFKNETMVRCVVDYPCGGINLDECAKINREISNYLQDSKLMGEDFSVDVNSPGLDRKLKTAADFKRVNGRTVMLWFDSPVYDQTYWEGELEFADSQTINLKTKDRILEIKIADIKTGKEKIAF